MAVTPDDVRHVAALARLELADAELAAFAAQLDGIVGHFAALRAADLGPVTDDDVPAPATFRADVPGSVPLAIPRERFAPAMREGFFLVPRLGSHADADAEPTGEA